ncbi:MAG TPA: hypothetical protein V6C58_13025 [Allocoleopsis sp.]
MTEIMDNYAHFITTNTKTIRRVISSMLVIMAIAHDKKPRSH